MQLQDHHNKPTGKHLNIKGHRPSLSECIYNLITAMGFSAMFISQVDHTKRKSLPAPHCRNGNCRYVQALPFRPSYSTFVSKRSITLNNLHYILSALLKAAISVLVTEKIKILVR